MKIVYPIVYALWYVLSLLPLRVLYVLSDGLFFLIYYVVRYRRPIVRKNLAASFPEKSEQELLAVERGFFHFFCDYLVESVKLMTTLPLWVTPKAQCGQIYHPIENAEFDQLFLSLRQRFGSVCIAMNDTLRELVGYRQKGQPVVIGFIADQVPHWRNIHHWCNFLNHDTPVLTGTERIARKMKQAAFYLELRRVKRGYYEAEFRLITRDVPAMAEYELTTRYFEMLEETIRRAPEYWLWSHNRWKRTREEFNAKFEVVGGKVIPKAIELRV